MAEVDVIPQETERLHANHIEKHFDSRKGKLKNNHRLLEFL